MTHYELEQDSSRHNRPPDSGIYLPHAGIREGVHLGRGKGLPHGLFLRLLPDFIIHATAYYTSYVELVAGFLLVVGFKRDYALYALASVLVIVTFGHGLSDPIWDLSHVMYRTILLVALLIFPKEWDRFSVDNLRLNRREKTLK